MGHQETGDWGRRKWGDFVLNFGGGGPLLDLKYKLGKGEESEFENKSASPKET